MKNSTRPEMKFLREFNGTMAGTVRLTGDTPSEIHPRGDECLCLLCLLLSGAAGLIVEGAQRRRVTKLSAGSGCVVPKGRWHRLRMREPGDLLFIRPLARKKAW